MNGNAESYCTCIKESSISLGSHLYNRYSLFLFVLLCQSIKMAVQNEQIHQLWSTVCDLTFQYQKLNAAEIYYKLCKIWQPTVWVMERYRSSVMFLINSIQIFRTKRGVEGWRQNIQITLLNMWMQKSGKSKASQLALLL